MRRPTPAAWCLGAAVVAAVAGAIVTLPHGGGASSPPATPVALAAPSSSAPILGAPAPPAFDPLTPPKSCTAWVRLNEDGTYWGEGVTNDQTGATYFTGDYFAQPQSLGWPVHVNGVACRFAIAHHDTTGALIP